MSKNDLKMQAQAIAEARGLAIDMVQTANSGHPGMPLGAMPMIFELWANHMKFNPKDPTWANRDRFILSAGHGSAMLYSMSYLFGHDYTIEDLKNFRQFGSKTPGHPDYEVSRGIEATTGALGQGLATAVGLALGERHLAAIFNTDEEMIFDNYTFVIAGDGCLMEGITAEASSFAGHLGLGNLIVLYDSNNITIDGNTEIAFTENVRARYEAYGWHTQLVEDGNDTEAIGKAIEAAKAEKNRPSLIEVKTLIGFSSPVEDSNKSHGNPLGEDGVKETKKKLGLNPEESFFVSPEVLDYCREIKKADQVENHDWQQLVERYLSKDNEKAEALRMYFSGEWSNLLDIAGIEDFSGKQATRSTSGAVLNKWSQVDPLLVGGSADLAGSNSTDLKDSGFMNRNDFSGKNIHYGVREFAMGAIANGLALAGLRSFCATFLVFIEYMYYDLRSAAMMEIPTMFVMTHDSIGLGEDGQTHQPIEHLSGLRAMPNLWVWRPADGKETVAAYATANRPGPALLALTRQKVETLENTSAEKAMKGAYILEENNVKDNKPELIIMATGSELEIAKAAYDELLAEDSTLSLRLVSMPCFEAFEEQDLEYRESVLPKSVTKRVSIEAAASMSWYKYVGREGSIIAIDRFGESAPIDALYKEFGFTKENVIKEVKNLLG